MHAAPRLTDDLYGAPVIGLTENDVVYSVAKLFFAYGLGNAMTFPLSAGATTVLMPARPTPDAVAALLHRHAVTVFFAVPTFYAAFLSADPVERAALSLTQLRLRRRGAAGRRRPALARALRRRHSRRHRLDRDAPHLPLQPHGRGPLRHHRQAAAGLRSAPRRRRRQAGGARRDGRDAGARADQRHHVLEQPRAVARDLPRRMDALRRQVHRGQGRLLRLLRPARRHAQGRRRLCRAVRGRGRAARATPTCSKRRWSPGPTRTS